MAETRFTENAHDAIESQIQELRAQLSSVTRSLSENGLDIDDLRDDASGFARQVTRHAREEVGAVAKTAHDAPAATGAALTLVGAIGFGLGYFFCLSQVEEPRHRWR